MLTDHHNRPTKHSNKLTNIFVCAEGLVPGCVSRWSLSHGAWLCLVPIRIAAGTSPRQRRRPQQPPKDTHTKLHIFSLTPAGLPLDAP